MEVRAILLDTRSIQHYIYSGTKLRTNIGASYIVAHFFEDVLVEEVLKSGKYGFSSVDTESWKNEKGDVKELPADAYVAYIGGGNALILLKNEGEDPRKAMVTDFTEKLLVRYPGLKTGAAFGMIDLNRFKEGMDALYRKLKVNQSEVYPIVNVPYTGLTVPCPVNGGTADCLNKNYGLEGNRKHFISHEAAAKAEAAEGANRELHRRFSSILHDDFCFPMELDDLGQKKGENDIAIVHIDGNNMGKKFSTVTTLGERSLLSRKVAHKTEASFGRLLADIVEDYGTYGAYLDLDWKAGMLPIRPLILGGDDVTFICNARLAVTYAVSFMRYMQEDRDGLSIDTCGGIAILPTSYPFFRGYELAEQVCDEAKEKSRPYSAKGEQSGWLDFIILHGEQAPDVSQIRQQEYRGALGNMHFGPYRVDGDENYHFHISRLLSCVSGFLQGNFPRNKAKELRFVLERGRHDIELYKEQLEHDSLHLPKVRGWENYAEHLWHENNHEYRTPYVDAVEMMDYVPGGDSRWTYR